MVDRVSKPAKRRGRLSPVLVSHRNCAAWRKRDSGISPVFFVRSESVKKQAKKGMVSSFPSTTWIHLT